MSLETYIALAVAMLVLAVTPGPGMFATIARALHGGFRPALSMIAGIVTGDLLFLLLAIFGLAVVAETLGEFFLIVKVLGGLYLIRLGWKMWKAEPTPMTIDESGGGESGGGRRLAAGFIPGLTITLGNPKVIIFYVAFLPTFIDLGQLTALNIAAVATVVSVVLASVLAGYAFLAARTRAVFKSRRAMRGLNRGAGTVMIGTGLVVATR